MYDRAPRVLIATAASNSTAENVGPGSYSHQQLGTLKSFAYAPFLSMAKRESFLTIKEHVAVAPGPAQYSPNVAGKIKGGGALKNRSIRFDPPLSVTPGPGKYEIPSTLKKKNKPHLRIHSSPLLSLTTPSKEPGVGVATGHLRYVRQNTAPSIPFPGQNYGYEENESGELKPQDFPQRDHTLGPAYYNVYTANTMTTKKYKGIHFGNLKSKRSEFKGRDGPAPTDYTPKISPESTTTTTTTAAATPINTKKLPRYHEIIPHQETKKGVPGPGKYNLPSQFSNSPPPYADIAIEPPPFGTSQQRFIEDTGCAPPSTKYEDPRTSLNYLKRISGMNKSPFGQTSVRFQVDKNAKEIPGPGSYINTDLTALSNQVKPPLVITTNGVFGTSSIRTVPLVKKDDYELPGPAQYHSNSSDTPSPVLRPSSMFSSNSKRLYSPPTIVTSIPPPGMYDVSDSYDKTQTKMEILPSTANSAFLSSNTRFAPPRDIALNETDSLNPGPGQYDSEWNTVIGTNEHGLICSRDERFKPIQKDHLGPGTYKLSKSLNDTVLKGTYNVSLENPLKVKEAERSFSARKKSIITLIV